MSWRVAGPFLAALALCHETVHSEPSALVLPRTFDKVWYRAKERSSFAMGRLHAARGDLTITESGIEFVARKKKLYIPLDLLRVVSFGKVKGDVDTDWVVLSVGEPGRAEIVGFRDGTKMGFGQATREIYDTIAGAARLAGKAQYAAPPGYVAFDGYSAQVTFAVPEAWELDLARAKVGSRRAWGTTVFAPPDTQGGATGESPSIFVELHDAEKGMRCDGLSKEAAEIVLGLAGARVRDDGFEGALESGPASVGGCQGLRLVARGRTGSGVEREIEIHAAAHDATLLLFGAYPPVGEAGKEWRDALGTALSTLTFPVAR